MPVEYESEIVAGLTIKGTRCYVLNGDIAGVGAYNYYMYCYDTTNGIELYKNPIVGGSVSTPFIYKDKIVTANWIGGFRVYCFNESDGSTVSGYPLQFTASGGTLNSPIVYNDRIYIGAGPWFWAIDINTATVPAPFPLTVTPEAINSTACAGEGKVYFGTSGMPDDQLYGIDATTGAIIPGFPVKLDSAVDGGITLANGVVYCGSNGNIIYAIDANNGTILWQYTLPSGPWSGSFYINPSIAENKLVVSSPKSNGIIVFVEPSPTATSTVTPTITLTHTHTSTPTITPTITETETIEDTFTHTPTITETAVDTATPTATPTATEGEFYLKLIGNFPNPFKDETQIIYELGKTSEVKIRIYTISGELVTNLQETGNAGTNSIRWDGRTTSNREAASGVYIFIIEATAGDKRAREWGKCAVVK